MKKIIVLLMVALLALALVACGGDSATTTKTTEASQAETTAATTGVDTAVTTEAGQVTTPATAETTAPTVTTGADNSGYFIATQSFTQDTLPVGSVIVLDEGWQYRPEAWKDSGVQSAATRPANVTERILIITEDFWQGYEMRAFNIAVKGNNVSIKNNPDAMSHFNIYIPKT